MKMFSRIILAWSASLLILPMGCSSAATKAETASADAPQAEQLLFSGDSAYLQVKRQVDFGPRVPGTQAHTAAAAYLEQKLREYGAEVVVQRDQALTFDGHTIPVINILGSVNPHAERRLLFLAHWDCRPWADQDTDPANRRKAVDGANDGASGVGVLLELARVASKALPEGVGADFLLVDAEDWGEEGDDESWALGTQRFLSAPPEEWKVPDFAVLVDMVGDKEACFPSEYYSRQAAPQLDAQLRALANELGYGEMFPDKIGSAVTDDHLQLIKYGVPAIDIIDYREGEGFCPQWHTADDGMSHISAKTLEAVGRTLELLIRKQ